MTGEILTLSVFKKTMRIFHINYVMPILSLYWRAFLRNVTLANESPYVWIPKIRLYPYVRGMSATLSLIRGFSSTRFGQEIFGHPTQIPWQCTLLSCVSSAINTTLFFGCIQNAALHVIFGVSSRKSRGIISSGKFSSLPGKWYRATCLSVCSPIYLL